MGKHGYHCGTVCTVQVLELQTVCFGANHISRIVPDRSMAWPLARDEAAVGCRLAHLWSRAVLW